jgi:hypothetical protein
VAARATSPPVDANVRSANSRRASLNDVPTGMVRAVGYSTLDGVRWCLGMISARVITDPRASTTARSTAFFKSRTLPGQD